MAAILAASLFADLGAGSVLAVCGAPNTGKTRYVQSADDAGALGRRVVFDPYATQDRIAVARGAKKTPWTGDVLSVYDLARHPSRLEARALRVVVQPSRVARHDRVCEREKRLCTGCEFALLADLLWAQGTVTVVGEEAALWSRDAVQSLLTLSSGGAHASLRVVMISQSYGRICKDARRHCNAIVAFAQGEETDFAALRAKSPTFAERVRALRIGDAPAVWRLGEAT